MVARNRAFFVEDHAVHPQRTKEYAGRIREGNCIEAHYYGSSSLETSLLRCYSDRYNAGPDKTSLSPVITLAKRDRFGKHRVTVGMHRSAIRDSFDKVDTTMCSLVLNTLSIGLHSYQNLTLRFQLNPLLKGINGLPR
jgi:hypothetical protein